MGQFHGQISTGTSYFAAILHRGGEGGNVDMRSAARTDQTVKQL